MNNRNKPMKRIKLNLKKTFDREAGILVSSYKTLITKRRGVRQDDAPDNKPSTIETKGRNHWLKDTSETKNNVFKKRTGKLFMEVFSSTAKHSGKRTYMGVKGGRFGRKKGVRRPRTEQRIIQSKSKPTYSQLMEWHNQEGYSGIFGGMWPVGSKAPERIGKEIRKQAFKQAIDQIGRTITLKMGSK